MSVICVFVFEPSAFAQNLNDLKAGVVKITTKTGQVGTGFIVRVEPEILYLITAAHVIEGDPEPRVEFFATRNMSVNGSVLPGAELNDDLRGLALVVVRGKVHIPDGVTALPFGKSVDLVAGGEEALVIGHPGGGGDWAILKRQISNRIGRDIALDPNVESRFSGGPIIVGDHVVGIVMSRREGFGLGITHKSVLNYMEGFEVLPGEITDASKKKSRGPIDLLPPGPASDLSIKVRPLLPKKITGRDGSLMILVPAGNFSMGSNEGEKGVQSSEFPQHEVYLDDFYIDQFEVTVQQYKRFMKEKKYTEPKYLEGIDLSQNSKKPVARINWYDAQTYCEWASKRLPSEAEWEKAARGTDNRTFPWGEVAPNSTTANFGKESPEKIHMDRLQNVGTYAKGKSPYGIYDMAGNVWEWVADWYSPDYYKASPKKNPKGPPSGDQKILRGGSWDYDKWYLPTFRRSWTNYPIGRGRSVGIRCAKDAP